MYLRDVPNPYLLLPLDEAWLQPIRDYDADLRIFPSQLRPVYRLGRVSTLLKPMDAAKFPVDTVHPDTAVALTKAFILVNWSLVGNISVHPATTVVQTLRRRDTWAFRRRKDDLESDVVGRLLDEQDEAEEAATWKAFRERTRQIGRAARLGVLYRTGQRVSLVRPLARVGTTAPPASTESSSPALPVTAVGAAQ
jgi:hypothetical protein